VNSIQVCALYDVILVPAIDYGLIYASGYGYVIWDDVVLADGYVLVALSDDVALKLCFLNSALPCYLGSWVDMLFYLLVVGTPINE
jgi:hypothetical protein